jgi:hypothetical protein
MKPLLLAAALLGACSLALAKLPPLDDAAKAKAAEAAAKAAWQAKVDNWQLCRSQDRVVAHYKGKSAAPVKPGAKDAKAAASAPMPTAAASAPMPTAAGSAPAGTPVAAAPPAPCMDPGPFAYAPPEQKSLESAGAHSPPATAASPPSVKAPSAELAPAGPKK